MAEENLISPRFQKLLEDNGKIDLDTLDNVKELRAPCLYMNMKRELSEVEKSVIRGVFTHFGMLRETTKEITLDLAEAIKANPRSISGIRAWLSRPFHGLPIASKIEVDVHLFNWGLLK